MHTFKYHYAIRIPLIVGELEHNSSQQSLALT
jgi:hypothetical protein